MVNLSGSLRFTDQLGSHGLRRLLISVHLSFQLIKSKQKSIINQFSTRQYRFSGYDIARTKGHLLDMD